MILLLSRWLLSSIYLRQQHSRPNTIGFCAPLLVQGERKNSSPIYLQRRIPMHNGDPHLFNLAGERGSQTGDKVGRHLFCAPRTAATRALSLSLSELWAGDQFVSDTI